MVRISVTAKKSPTKVTTCCRKGDPFQGLKLGSCLTLGNELYEETRVLTKQEILLGKGTCVESSRVREPRRTALPRGAKMDASKRDSGKWMDTWCLLLTFPELFLLVVAY